jgi:hypothetical protein
MLAATLGTFTGLYATVLVSANPSANLFGIALLIGNTALLTVCAYYLLFSSEVEAFLGNRKP